MMTLFWAFRSCHWTVFTPSPRCCRRQQLTTRYADMLFWSQFGLDLGNHIHDDRGAPRGAGSPLAPWEPFSIWRGIPQPLSRGANPTGACQEPLTTPGHPQTFSSHWTCLVSPFFPFCFQLQPSAATSPLRRCCSCFHFRIVILLMSCSA